MKQKIAGYELLAWKSSSEDHPALNIAGEHDDEDGGETYGVELHIRRGAIVGVFVNDSTSTVGEFGLLPEKSA